MKTPRCLAIVLPALAAGLLAACGEAEKTCAPDQQLCSGACVSLQSDSRNCGACANACGAGQGCSLGACVDCAANPAACTADVAVACFNTNEVRFVGSDLTLVGPPLAVGAGPIALARLGGTFFVANDLSSTISPFTLAPLAAGAALQVPAVTADLSAIAEHGGLLWASSSGVGTLVVVDPAAARVVREIPLSTSASERTNPRGIDFVGTKAYLALADAGAVAVLDIANPAAATVLKRIPLAHHATGTATASPANVLAANGKVYVTLNNVIDSAFVRVPGANGRLVVIDPSTDTVVGDAALDLGPDCLDANAMALSGTTLWVACGYYDFVTVQGAGLIPISIAGAAPVPGAIVKTTSALDALAVCGGRGYAGAAESGTVLQFDVASGAVAGSSVVCPTGTFGSFVADLACAR
jgi:DNA-binding beta-propeller fold protein YncE